MRISYSVGDVFFAGLKTNDRQSSGNLGRITIGGDRGDVGSVSAFSSQLDGEEGVVVEDVTLLTTLELTEDEAEDEVREVVRACYDSIQEETFTQSKLNDTQLADLSYIARYADSVKEKLVNRGEQKHSPLLVHLDRIADLARNLRENLKII